MNDVSDTSGGPLTLSVADAPDETAPDGSLIFWLCRNSQASTCICKLPPGYVSKPVRHGRVSELWYVISGAGELYRSGINHEQPVALQAGVAVSIPVGHVFQFRAAKATELTIHITTTPPWSGDDDATTQVTGLW